MPIAEGDGITDYADCTEYTDCVVARPPFEGRLSASRSLRGGTNAAMGIVRSAAVGGASTGRAAEGDGILDYADCTEYTDTSVAVLALSGP